MKSTAIWLIVFVAGCCLATRAGAARVSLSPDQKKELSQIRKDISRIASLIRRKDLEKAQKMIDEADSRLKKIAADAKLPTSNKLLAGIRKSLSMQRHALAVRKDPKKAKEQAKITISFVKHVAPILNEKCVKCHSDDPGGGLHLETFAGMKKGGTSGPLLVIGSPSRSLMMRRLLAPAEKDRMPKKAPPLSRKELTILAIWITQGAKFDGKDEETELGDLGKPPPPPISVPVATGSGTVSFKRDIAPFMMDHCVRCHRGKKPSGELLLETVEGFMRGGRDGRVIVPGKPEDSLVYQLMGSFDETRRMPLEGKVTRKNYDDMGTWIREGAKYDGGNPKLTLSELNPTQDQTKTAEMAAMTSEQFVTFRETRSAEQWKKALPDEEPHSINTHDILFYGNVAEDRLGDIVKWTEKHLEVVRTLFALGEDDLLWKGKLTVFIFKDTATYETFRSSVTESQVPELVVGMMKVTETFEDAFIALPDTGDKSDAEVPTLKFNLLSRLTQAYQATSATMYPEWFSLGLGLALAAGQGNKRDKYADRLRDAAVDSLKELEKPTDVFKNGAFFSSERTRPVGFTLVEFLLKNGHEQRLTQFIKALQNGGEVGNALRVVYHTDLEPIARNYFSTFKTRRSRKH